MKNFRVKILKYLKESDLSQSDLAKMLDMSDSCLSMYMREHRTPSIDTAIAIEQRLGMSAGYLVYDFQDMKEMQQIPVLEKKDIDNYIKKGILPRDVEFFHVSLNAEKGGVMQERKFFMRVEGNAMANNPVINKGICDGDSVEVKPCREVNHGALVLLAVDGDFKVREAVKDGSDCYYKSYDPNLPILSNRDAFLVGKVCSKRVIID